MSIALLLFHFTCMRDCLLSMVMPMSSRLRTFLKKRKSHARKAKCQMKKTEKPNGNKRNETDTFLKKQLLVNSGSLLINKCGLKENVHQGSFYSAVSFPRMPFPGTYCKYGIWDPEVASYRDPRWLGALVCKMAGSEQGALTHKSYFRMLCLLSRRLYIKFYHLWCFFVCFENISLQVVSRESC